VAGGGFDGTVVTGESLLSSDPAIPLPLKQGYVTFGSDSGHQGAFRNAAALNAVVRSGGFKNEIHADEA